MNGDIRVRQPRGEEGFSFVELLVTILIAGIAFAAMVPFFVQGQGKNSADNARNVALQIAQDKIEKVRQLDYDQIELTNLNDAGYAGGQFGPYWDFVRNGATKRYSIAYTVDVVPTGAQPGEEKYKKVEVSVSWTAPPAPVKPAVVQTLVYRQYAGPKIIDFDVGWPGKTGEQDAGIESSPVTIDVWINPADIAGMNASAANVDDRGWVKFFISAMNGGVVAQSEVASEHNGEPGRYRYTWDNSAVADGQYTIQFMAFSALEMPGPKLSLSYEVKVTTPPAPTDLTVDSANAGSGELRLSWNPVPIGDAHHYEVWRGTASGAEVFLADVGLLSSWLDNGLVDGTTYYYKVRVVDTDGNLGVFSSEASGVPGVNTDTTPPTVPTGLTAAKLPGSPTIILDWNASTDDVVPSPWYVIQRGSGPGGPWTELANMHGTLTYPDSSAGWSSTWYYRVAATDGPNQSAFSAAVGPVTTDVQPRYTLTVSNTRNSDIYVWVQNAGSGLWYSTAGAASAMKPSGQRVKKNKQVIWYSLPAGVYYVFASSDAGGLNPVSSIGGSSDLSSGPGTISY